MASEAGAAKRNAALLELLALLSLRTCLFRPQTPKYYCPFNIENGVVQQI